jgi:hypothetical protein
MKKITLSLCCGFLALAGLTANAGCGHSTAVEATAQTEMNASPTTRAQENQQAMQRIQNTQNMPPQVKAEMLAAQNHQQHP